MFAFHFLLLFALKVCIFVLVGCLACLSIMFSRVTFPVCSIFITVVCLFVCFGLVGDFVCFGLIVCLVLSCVLACLFVLTSPFVYLDWSCVLAW